ncbi:hypothetical protein EGR_03798 [Echinococcus granulosus]|uniref:Uncharacterized protein n=1 Tax=Echinococcus granulosus TaxID=6210 RepID=W6USG7_ECHGR|nr:hypothetical protein EGR_03798 [Echinococcus granulosus]EUB61312.1 hypothetical protein EGR_03798 [Echinococcus granulosus]
MPRRKSLQNQTKELEKYLLNCILVTSLVNKVSKWSTGEFLLHAKSGKEETEDSHSPLLSVNALPAEPIHFRTRHKQMASTFGIAEIHS